jgi:hypothetical protein
LKCFACPDRNFNNASFGIHDIDATVKSRYAALVSLLTNTTTTTALKSRYAALLANTTTPTDNEEDTLSNETVLSLAFGEQGGNSSCSSQNIALWALANFTSSSFWDSFFVANANANTDADADATPLITLYALAVLWISTRGPTWHVKNESNNNNVTSTTTNAQQQQQPASSLWFREGNFNWCEWHGVVCLPHSDIVGSLRLKETNLTGSLPSEIGLFVELQQVQLEENDLSGTIPMALFQLEKLSTW